MHTVIVKYPLPAPVPRETMLQAFRAAEGQFRHVPGLIRKYFCYDEERHTGHSVYLFETEAQAQDFFGEGFTKAMQEKFGTTPEWYGLDTLHVVDNSLDRADNPV